MRLIAYCRVSTAGQERDGVSLAAQLERVEAYCTAYGHEIVEAVQEQASAATMNRPGLLDALAAIRDGHADGLIIAALDRLTRNTRSMLELAEHLDATGSVIISVQEHMDTTTPHGRFALTMLAAVNQLEHERIRARTRHGLRQVKREGRQIGRAPAGWINARSTNDDAPAGALLPDAPTLDAARRARSLRSRGRTYAAIGRTLGVSLDRARTLAAAPLPEELREHAGFFYPAPSEQCASEA